MRNEIILDGKVQKNVQIFDEIINFNLSAITGKYQTPENRVKNRYTFIRVVYVGTIDDRIRNILRTGNHVRIYGKIDSEQYRSKTGKIVYNKILVVDRVSQIEYDSEFGFWVEV